MSVAFESLLGSLLDTEHKSSITEGRISSTPCLCGSIALHADIFRPSPEPARRADV